METETLDHRMRKEKFKGGGFVLHGIRPCWVTYGCQVSAWFDETGVLLDVEVRTPRGVRPAKRNAAIWNHCKSLGPIWKGDRK